MRFHHGGRINSYCSRRGERVAHGLSSNAERSGDHAHRDAAAVQLHRFCGFLDCESVLAAHNVVSGEVLRDGRAMHTILVSQVSDTETSKVIVDQAVYFRGGEKGLRFPNPPDTRSSYVVNWGIIGPLRYPVYPSFPARNQRYQLRGRV